MSLSPSSEPLIRVGSRLPGSKGSPGTASQSGAGRGLGRGPGLEMSAILVKVSALIILGVAAGCCEEDDRIVGGSECVPHSVPYQVYIRNFRRPWCGASLLNAHWILTAAHCYIRPKVLNVWVGAHDLSVEESSRQSLRVIRAIRHPGYDYGTTDNDIMLLKVSPAVRFNDNVRPVQLPGSCSRNGTRCLVSGWGNTAIDGEAYPNRLQCLDVPILSDAECRASYGDSLTPNMFCAGFLEGGKEACQVDSGGPLVCDGVQRGIVSWGLDCGRPGYTTIYTKLCNYTAWINETITAN
ncbi:trypsin-like [Hemiscyllium ocellatum]|uniref:trypsin-like n=1 Tax=Hemiscyllium ocellatum TaxID=170820 RepID=UPI002966A40E|nr:trypsin-like [Hemiscyllium ocellatum]